MVKPSGMIIPLSPGKAEAVSRPKDVDENSEEVKTLREQSLGTKRCLSFFVGGFKKMLMKMMKICRELYTIFEYITLIT
jgi:hypothetical protein